MAALQFYLSACSGVKSKQGREEQQRAQSVYSGGKSHLLHWPLHLLGHENSPTWLSTTWGIAVDRRQPTTTEHPDSYRTSKLNIGLGEHMCSSWLWIISFFLSNMLCVHTKWSMTMHAMTNDHVDVEQLLLLSSLHDLWLVSYFITSHDVQRELWVPSSFLVVLVWTVPPNSYVFATFAIQSIALVPLVGGFNRRFPKALVPTVWD